MSCLLKGTMSPACVFVCLLLACVHYSRNFYRLQTIRSHTLFQPWHIVSHSPCFVKHLSFKKMSLFHFRFNWLLAKLPAPFRLLPGRYPSGTLPESSGTLPVAQIIKTTLYKIQCTFSFSRTSLANCATRPPTQASGPPRSGAGVGVSMLRAAGNSCTWLF